MQSSLTSKPPLCLLNTEIVSTHIWFSQGSWGSELRSTRLYSSTLLNEPSPQLHTRVSEDPQAYLVQAAATGVLQVAQVELQHLSFQLTELDARFLHKSLVDLLYLLCGENGSEQNNQLRSNFLSNS